MSTYEPDPETPRTLNPPARPGLNLRPAAIPV